MFIRWRPVIFLNVPVQPQCGRTLTDVSYGICWDLGDVIFAEETEVKNVAGITERVVLVPGVGELLHSLAKRGIPMAIVSDTRIGACENVLDPHGLRECFAHWTISEALGVEKPHPLMFTSAAEALGLPPERLAMVGNNYHRDIEGADRVGLTAIWFNWNDRYPAPDPASAADYVVGDAAGIGAAIEHWIASLGKA
jgi:HAD superfamily hydrolase (TIGR01509 family)